MTKFQHHTIDLETAYLPIATQVTCLGDVFDCELTFFKHVTSVVRRCFYHLRQIRAVRKSLITESVKTLIDALIASRLDYCNSVFYQLSAANLQALKYNISKESTGNVSVKVTGTERQVECRLHRGDDSKTMMKSRCLGV